MYTFFNEHVIENVTIEEVVQTIANNKCNEAYCGMWHRGKDKWDRYILISQENNMWLYGKQSYNQLAPTFQEIGSKVAKDRLQGDFGLMEADKYLELHQCPHYQWIEEFLGGKKKNLIPLRYWYVYVTMNNCQKIAGFYHSYDAINFIYAPHNKQWILSKPLFLPIKLKNAIFITHKQ